MVKTSLVSVLLGLALSGFGAEAVVVDWERPVGDVKPVNGVGQPPMVGQLAGWPMMHYLKEDK